MSKYTRMLVLAIAVLVVPAAFAQLPEISIDLDRNTAGVQLDAPKTPGAVIQGAVYLAPGGSVTEFHGYNLLVTVTPADAVAAVSTGPGADLYDQLLGTEKSDATAGIIGRSVVHSTGAAPKRALPQDVFTFDLTLADPLPDGNIILHLVTSVENEQMGLFLDFGAGTTLLITDATMVHPDSVIGAAVPPDTPTDTPVGETPTETPTPVDTETPVDSPTDTPIGETPTETPTVPADTPTETPTSTPTEEPTPEDIGYVILDGFGGQHTLGTATTLVPDDGNEDEYWPYFYDPVADFAWDRAVDLEFLADRTSRKMLTALGQVITIAKGSPTTYDWSMVDLGDTTKFVGLACTASGNGAYLLDRYGFVHVMGDADPALGGQVTVEPLPGDDIRAVDIEVTANEDSVYVLDSYGGVYIQGAAAAERAGLPRAFFGWDIARDLEFFTANELDCVLDGFGVVHAVSGEALPDEFLGTIENTRALSTWGWDIARNLEFGADFKSAWTLDGFGPAHMAGTAQYIPGLWFGWDIAVDFELYIPASTIAFE